MKKFVLTRRVKAHIILSIPGSVLVYFLEPYVWWKALSIFLFLFSIIGVIDVFASCFRVESDKLIAVSLFKRKHIYWKDIRFVKLNYKNNQIGKEVIWLLKSEDIMNIRPGKTFSVSYMINGYKELTEIIVRKCESNNPIHIDEEVLKLTREK